MSTSPQSSVQSSVQASVQPSVQQLDQQNSQAQSRLIPSFISNTLKNYLDTEYAAHNGAPMLQPIAFESFAVVVMADVSGYSKLSAILAEKGPIGAEILSKTMKGYLDKIIRIVLSHEGDIVKFAGDAVIIMWKADMTGTDGVQCMREGKDSVKDGGNPMSIICRCANCVKGELVLKGSVCCLELLQNLGKYRVNIEGCSVNELNIHLGIGSGQIYDIHVKGDEERWEHFVVGDPMTQLGVVLNLAKPEQLALSHASYQYLKRVVNANLFHIGEYDKRCIILEGLKLMEEMMVTSRKRRAVPLASEDKLAKIDEDHLRLYRKYVNPSVLYKLRNNEDFTNINELRQVTTIFIKLDMPSVARGPEEFLSSAQFAMSAVQRSMRRYEGILRQFHVDDKGAVMLCFFGLPPLAHDNDAYWAMRAAVDVRHAFRNGNIDHFAIGITTGTISIGGVGTEVRTEYALMGDSINLAARIMCQPLAKEDILCDDRTYMQCKKDFDLEPLGSVVVKGKPNPVDIFKPKDMLVKKKWLGILTNADTPCEQAKVIGREQEKSRLRDFLERSRRSEFARMGVEGEGGQGLTTLAAYLRGQAMDRKIMVAAGCSSEMDKSVPFNALQDLVCDLFRHLEVLPDIDARSLRTDGSSKSFASGLGPMEDASPPKRGGTIMTESGPLPHVRANTPGSMLDDPSVSDIQENHPVRSQSRLDLKQLRHVSMLISTQSTDQLFSAGKISRPRLNSSQIRTRLNTEEVNNTFEGHIKLGLAKAGEPTKYSSLFNMIFPDEFNDKDRSKYRMKELTDLILRLVSWLSHHAPIILMMSEAQWADSLSWNLLHEIMENCHKVGIIIFSRPEKQYSDPNILSAYQIFKSNMKTTNLSITGLNATDLVKCISFWYEDPEVHRVESKLVDAVQKRSNGNCLHARGVVLALKEAKHLAVHEGSLGVNKSVTDEELEKIMPSLDLQSIIIAQFDHLDPHFQQLLKTAAVIGRDFALEDVLHFVNARHEITEEHIVNFDKYGYIRKVSNDDNLYVYAFKSSMVRQCIYSMMMKPQQQLVHHYLARYYEDSLEHSNRHRLLVRIYEHYKKSGSNTKSRQYLAAVAHDYFESRNIAEAISHYEMLMGQVSHLQTDQLFASDSDRLEWANWTRELGECHLQRKNPEVAERWLLKSLQCFQCELPTSHFKLKVETAKLNLSKVVSFFLKRSQNRPSPSLEGQQLRVLLLAVAVTFRDLQKFEAFQWAVYTGLAMSDAYNDDSVTAEFLAMAGMIEWDKSGKRAPAWETLIRVEEICRQDQRPAMHNIVGVGSVMADALLRAAHYDQAIIKFKMVLQYADIASDWRHYQMANTALSWMHYIRMAHNSSYCLARTLWQKGKDDEEMEMQIMGASMILLNLFLWDDGTQQLNVQHYYQDLLIHSNSPMSPTLRYISAAALLHSTLYLKAHDETNENLHKLAIALKSADTTSWTILIGHMMTLHWIHKSLTTSAYDTNTKKQCTKILDQISKGLEKHMVYDFSQHMELLCKALRMALTTNDKEFIPFVRATVSTADPAKMGCALTILRKIGGIETGAILTSAKLESVTGSSKEIAAPAA